MKTIFFAAEQDTLLASLLTLKSVNVLSETDEIIRFAVPKPKSMPYVPDYLVDYDATSQALNLFVTNEIYNGMRRINAFVALPDDCTTIETKALEDLMLATNKCKNVMTEFISYLLSEETEYLAVTASKRAVILTHIDTDASESEQIFLDISTADQEAVESAIQLLDETATLPVYAYGLPDAIDVGTAVDIDIIISNFVRLQ